MRTSLSHPLKIDEIEVGPGRIGLTICPGKKGHSVFGDPWDRDLSTDTSAISHWGADAVVSLIEEGEMRALGVPHLGAAVSMAELIWHHFPIPDLAAPDATAMKAWTTLSLGLHQTLDRGGRILVHCRGGLGRSGVIAALLLIERGEPWSSAMSIVRDARPGAIKTSVQEEFLRLQPGPKDRRTELVRASLFGGAIGDAHGAEIEFWSLRDILDRFPRGVHEMLAHQDRIGVITDDTLHGRRSARRAKPCFRERHLLSAGRRPSCAFALVRDTGRQTATSDRRDRTGSRPAPPCSSGARKVPACRRSVRPDASGRWRTTTPKVAGRSFGSPRLC